MNGREKVMVDINTLVSTNDTVAFQSIIGDTVLIQLTREIEKTYGIIDNLTPEAVQYASDISQVEIAKIIPLLQQLIFELQKVYLAVFEV